MSVTTVADTQTLCERHVDLLTRGERLAALREATAVIEAGLPLADFVLGVLAPVQAEIGRRWQTGQITTAHERAATEVAEILLTVAAGRRTPEPSGIRLVMCLADNEHHNLPARMVAELLRAEGHHIVFLGSPKPRRALGEMIAKLQPDAVVLSCSLTMNLPGVVGLAGLSREANIPVIVGGAAFSADPVRAARVGADHHAVRISEVAALASARVQSDLGGGPSRQRMDEWAALVQSRRRLAVEVAERVIWYSSPVVPTRMRTPTALAQCVSDLMRFLEAAVLVDDHILIDYARWHRDHHTATSADPQFTSALLRAVCEQLLTTTPTAASIADAAFCTLVAGPPSTDAGHGVAPAAPFRATGQLT